MAIGLEQLLTLLAELQRDPQRRLGLSALARQVQLSPTHFQRVFQAEIGESAQQLGVRIALQRAAAALLATQLSVLEIALDSGFESHEGFTRAFRRRFGTTPSDYRRRGIWGSDGSIAGSTRRGIVLQHRDTVERTAPCIGLFRTSLSDVQTNHTSDKESQMKYTVEQKALAAIHVLTIRQRTTADRIADTLAQVLPQVFAYASGNGVPMVGPPFCRYRDWSPGGVTVEGGLPIGAPHPGEGEVVGATWPAREVAATVHVGPYDSLNHAYSAVEAWLQERGLATTEDPYEVYLTDPGQVPDPAEWRTEIVWPLAQ